MLNHEPGSSHPPDSFYPGSSPAQGLEGMGAATWGVEERGGGKGRYSRLRYLSGWIQWLAPRWPRLLASGWRLPGRPTPQAVLGSPQLAHRPGQPRFRAQKLDQTWSSWSSCRAQGAGSYRWARPFAHCAQGCTSCMKAKTPEPREGWRRAGETKGKEDLCPPLALRARDLLDPWLLI